MNTKKTIAERFGKLKHYLEVKADGASFARRAIMVIESLFGRVFLGVTVEDYFQYGFYEKNWYGRSKYYTWGKRQKLTRSVNDPKDADIFTDKGRFVKSFEKYLGRAVLDMRTATRDQFFALTQNNEKLFIKPIDGSWGLGTSIVPCGEENTIPLFEKLEGKPLLAEEVINQHKELAQFNTSSTNTIRVVTFLNHEGNPIIMPGAILRTGRKGKIADNFHHQGIASFVDNDTGLVCTRGVDKEGNRYVIHPDSGIPLVGFKIPEWEKIKRLVLEAALVCPKVRYVGWDVTVTDDNKVILIEGNDRADPDIAQMSLGEGIWDEYKSFR